MSVNYCSNCGAPLAPGVRFCASCGVPADTEATRVVAPRTNLNFPTQSNFPAVHAQGSEPEEQTIFVARPTMLFIFVSYVAAAFLAVLLTIALAYAGLPAWAPLLVALPVLLFPVLRHIQRRSITYRLTDSKIELEHGLLARTTRSIPLRSIQDVTVSRTLLQRILGFGDIRLDDASEHSGSTLLHNIPDPAGHADKILRQLRRRF